MSPKNKRRENFKGLEDLTVGRNLWQYWTRDMGVEEDNFLLLVIMVKGRNESGRSRDRPIFETVEKNSLWLAILFIR